MIFVTWNPEKIWHESFTDCPPHLSFVATVPWEIQQSFSTVLFIHTSDYLCYLTKKTIYNPLAHPTWKCHHTNLWIAKLLMWGCVHSNVRGSEKSQLWVVVGGSEKNRLWCVATRMSGMQCHSKVFRVTTFCVCTCFQSFSTLISRTLLHAVLKFSPCHNKPLPQASTCHYQYTPSSCSMPQTQY